jgi:hypothetical protein
MTLPHISSAQSKSSTFADTSQGVLFLANPPRRMARQRNRMQNAKVYCVYNHGSEGRDVERFD